MTAASIATVDHPENRMAQHDITTREALHEQLYKALQLEHSTIPPYLTALYSIKPDTNRNCSLILREVVVEEMLHLAIAANVLNAVGGRPNLTRPGFVANYPAPLSDGEDDFEVELRPFSEDLIKIFLQIERPAMAEGQPKLTAKRAGVVSPMLPTPPGRPDCRYYSIGEFYKAILDGLAYLEDEARAAGKTIFVGDPHRQVTSSAYYSAGGRLPVVTDLESATKAIRFIIGQGEGELQGVHDDDGELAHYYQFDQISRGRKYLPGDRPHAPSGVTFKVDYDDAYPVKPNIKLADYPPGSELLHAARSFNEAYATFLAFLTTAFNGHPELMLETAVPDMFRFRDWINILVRNPLPGTEFHAGPTFEIDEIPSEDAG